LGDTQPCATPPRSNVLPTLTPMLQVGWAILVVGSVALVAMLQAKGQAA
jgi:hypothetical protein